MHTQTASSVQVISGARHAASAMADYDFLRATYEMLLRAPHPNRSAINHAFDALDAAHARLKASHEQFRVLVLN